MRREFQSILAGNYGSCPRDTVGDYLRALIKAGRLVVGIEGGESDLAYAIRQASKR